jgi:hypothetical protein
MRYFPLKFCRGEAWDSVLEHMVWRKLLSDRSDGDASRKDFAERMKFIKFVPRSIAVCRLPRPLLKWNWSDKIMAAMS